MEVRWLQERRFRVRSAARADVPQIVALLRDDAIGAAREVAVLETYEQAFAAIDADPAQVLAVVDDGAGVVVGTLRLTFIPGLSRGGALRAQIEAVRIAGSVRGSGLGTALLEWAIGESRRRGAALVQLTTDVHREDAHRFYERLGFEATHLGMKLVLPG